MSPAWSQRWPMRCPRGCRSKGGPRRLKIRSSHCGCRESGDAGGGRHHNLGLRSPVGEGGPPGLSGAVQLLKYDGEKLSCGGDVSATGVDPRLSGFVSVDGKRAGCEAFQRDRHVGDRRPGTAFKAGQGMDDGAKIGRESPPLVDVYQLGLQTAGGQ